jgi:hypothetical protein
MATQTYCADSRKQQTKYIQPKLLPIEAKRDYIQAVFAQAVFAFKAASGDSVNRPCHALGKTTERGFHLLALGTTNVL